MFIINTMLIVSFPNTNDKYTQENQRRNSTSVGLNIGRIFCCCRLKNVEFYFLSLMTSRMSKIVFWKSIASPSKEDIGATD